MGRTDQRIRKKQVTLTVAFSGASEGKFCLPLVKVYGGKSRTFARKHKKKRYNIIKTYSVYYQSIRFYIYNKCEFSYGFIFSFRRYFRWFIGRVLVKPKHIAMVKGSNLACSKQRKSKSSSVSRGYFSFNSET